MSQTLTVAQVKELIPNRFPILYIDKVTSLEFGQEIIAQKQITYNEDFCQSQPENPHMLGTLVLETLAQAGSILILKTPEFLGKTAYIGGINDAHFYEFVRPGDTLELRFSITRMKGNVGTADAVATVGEKKVADCVFTFIVGAK
ncbi:3-hydroxyacyl-ACP dehydratase FabZ family protein [Enterococcus dispar]|uniref:(3R)-hydroxymyristoyl-[acyl carrier protein] dehydratase n=1 Tax=Enterococcus dispar ATCC 51266 TaxID=1139219 RepID=S0KQU5_9ENTE|nr:3-hydroxyacyl-ACP dehydratase FabZ family protein [Enterococcus dispar]EOT43345.1 (3R)-hydroxymyristoyl-[acyl carrier protein] dehydratase [Enterococcus dispar ATCC 51266]EOW85207.1 (3R)-hydroxymyristoyl-[acyl carrier protein] dehydratase [Enterococcus dispar ATCC 51266]OJG40101.1 (3R)-hydroxymyristoyl-[acyl carrier protein] dehydratase [Enterococcus dispar]WCG33225.1 beta-hydroxyacyl-ACP dehydratase [Enterococcus dispar]